ncbi:MAG: Do family serine endopeptidase [Acidimicrobiia bacterium]|nr:Do family serine endopeptidase [Acidimicrobiia bacterium]
MSNRKTSFFNALLIAIVSIAVGMVLASRLGLAPESRAQSTSQPPPQNSAPIGGPLDATTFKNIAKAASPAVVNIRTESRQRGRDLSDFFGGGGDDLLERFFGGGSGGGGGQAPAPRDRVTEAAGTGFIIDKAGFILTNNHVVENATKIEVSLYGEDDDHVYEAQVIGRDPLTDSALIQLTEMPDQELPQVKFGDSDQMEPGDWVMAIGNPFGLAHTVSVGVISAVGRLFPVADQRWERVLQTDAAINPGNSGGPLLNIRGEVVGINTAIFSDARQSGNIGIGFAMPINVVRDLLPQLHTGKVTRGLIGVGVLPIPAQGFEELGLASRTGALVSTVSKDGPSDKAGVRPGDVITEFNGRAVKNNNDLVSMVVATRPGTTVPMKVLRDRRPVTLNLTIGELNLEEEAVPQQSSRDVQEEVSQGFGVTIANITPEVARRLRLGRDVQGAVIMNVQQGSPAARAGLSPGDVILEVNRNPVSSASEAGSQLNQVRPRTTAFLLVLRNGVETFVTITKD